MPRFVATGFLYHRILSQQGNDFNRRILKTVCPVVWEGAGAQSFAIDLITDSPRNPEKMHSVVQPLCYRTRLCRLEAPFLQATFRSSVRGSAVGQSRDQPVAVLNGSL